MSKRTKVIIGESRIINCFRNFNKNLVTFFLNSSTYRIFKAANSLFRSIIIRPLSGSRLIAAVKEIPSGISARDIGLFIILVTAFNTGFMLLFKIDIDGFSAAYRILGFSAGLILIMRRR